jgi:hypothetical protein
MSFKSRSASDRTERNRIVAEPYTRQARAEKLQPIDSAIKKHYDDARFAILKAISEAEKEYARHLPTTTQRLAALKNPERATAVRDLATGLRAKELVMLAKATGAAGDAPAAFGLRMALSAVPATAATAFFTDIEAHDFHEALNSIGAAERKEALVDVVSARDQLLRLESAGPYLVLHDTLINDPVSLMRGVESIASVEINEGVTRRLPDAQVKELCELGGFTVADDRVDPEPGVGTFRDDQITDD